MSVIALNPQHFDTVSVRMHPSRSFASGSINPLAHGTMCEGVTGSIFVYADRSSIERDVEFTMSPRQSNSPWNRGEVVNLINIFHEMETEKKKDLDGDLVPDISTIVQSYTASAHLLPQAAKKRQMVSISRHHASHHFTTESYVGRNVRNVLYPHYRGQYSNMNWAYGNYHTLNFFTGSMQLAMNTVLIYPAPTSTYKFDKIIPILADEEAPAGEAFKYVFKIPQPGEVFEDDDDDFPDKDDPFGEVEPKSISALPEGYEPEGFKSQAPGLVPPKVPPIGAIKSNIETIIQTYYPYRPDRSFTFEFWINPRYNNLDNKGEFKAGTVLHMSSCYAISLVTASYDQAYERRDLQDRPMRFQMMLQLSHSANWPPSTIRLDEENNGSRDYPKDLIFLSSASLLHNHWHHVAIRWGGYRVNGNYGDFVIDGEVDTRFHLGLGLHVSRSCMPNAKSPYTAAPDASSGKWPNVEESQPDALFVGNFYNGRNNYTDPSTGATDSRNTISQFFNLDTAKDEGTPVINPDDSNEIDPLEANFDLTHPLQAEIHEVRIWKTWRSLDEIRFYSRLGLGIITRRKLTGVSPLGTPITEVGDSTPGGSVPDPDLMFYLPPYFIKESPMQNYLQTPYGVFSDISSYDSISGKNLKVEQSTPFNKELAFNVNMRDINLSNFVRDFVLSSYPRSYNLTGAINVSNTNIPQTPLNSPGPLAMADGYGTLFTTTFPPEVSGEDKALDAYAIGNDQEQRERANKRNLTILPCDNGLFRPTIPETLLTGSLTYDMWKSSFLDARHLEPAGPLGAPLLDRFVTDLGVLDFGLVSLGNILEGKVLDHWFDQEAGTSQFMKVMMEYLGWRGPTPVYPGWNDEYQLEPRVAYEMKELKNPAGSGLVGTNWLVESNFYSYYNIPNLYYGDMIKPGSFVLRGMAGVMKTSGILPFMDQIPITLKDDGRGGLYRANALTAHAKWNLVGDIFYADGLVVVKSPHIFDMGQLGFSTEFQGSRNMHVLEIMIPAGCEMFNSSSNPSFRKLRPSDHANDQAAKFVYLTGLNFHDDNFNIIARTNLAQPVIKRHGDKLFFRVKIDF